MLNGKITTTLETVFSQDYHCYSSSPGEQVDMHSLQESICRQWQDVSLLIIEKGESISIVDYAISNVPSCLPFLCHL